ncbi:hemicentin-2-like isoform X2 [Stegastes partitus]|uniref:Hemicentin-2-like isoform X2 n=1 Tax=Stegastes partitus TaxID=144197 RepID=A0A9Y4NQJ0_9TELE|nr:PREDICTED: hemicentin-2-like isoform X2 [Stegastes partitus]
MFSVNQVALLFILLSVTWRVCAAAAPTDDCRNILVSRGNSVMFCCNISSINATQITWIKGRSRFVHAVTSNQTFSDFSSPRVTIDHNLPTKLSISSAQPEDEGLYTCNISSVLGVNSMKWNLTVSENPEDDHRSMLVSRGDPIMFCCNISSINATQITWIKGRSYFTHAVSLNQTFSNFSSPRVTIDHNLPTKLSISSAQPEDAGLYTCRVSAVLGFNSMKWNLTVSENPEATHRPWYFVYILTPAIGLLLCGVMSVVCLCRKFRTRTPNGDPVQNQDPPQPGEEVPLRQGHRANNKKRSQYKERLNSIYGHM